MFNRNKKVQKQFDWPLLLITIAIGVYGLFVLRSATLTLTDSVSYLKSQGFASLVGLFVIFVLLWVDTDFLKRMAVPLYLVSCVLLLSTILFGYGEEEWGANLWLRVGPVSFQPSEFAKIGIILSFGAFLEKSHKTINHPLTLLKVLIIMGIPLVLVYKQDDFGTMMVFAFFLALMLFASGLHWGYVCSAIVLVGASVPLVYNMLDSYRKDRILDFLDPSRNPLGSGYQAMQGTIAIGSGQLFGRGYLQGVQSQFGFLPEQQTDFIFAVVGEEFGFIGGLLLILAYTFLLYRILTVARKAKDVFGATVSIGVAAMIFVHIFENIGMTIGLMPVTGIPLPLMSYGGTFQLIVLTGIGLVLSIGMQRHPLDFNASL